MGQRTKGSMWCPHCQQPVLGVKTTHRVRNTASGLLLPLTGGLSLLGLRSERYACPRCGSAVHRRTTPEARVAALALSALIVLILIIQHL